jgi:CNT family concentrative nucleoside transporter
MVGGMATVAGSVLGAYTALLKDKIPDIAGHLLTASVLSAPAALVVAKLMIPEDSKPETLGQVPEEYKKHRMDTNVIEAIARGAGEGLTLALNVAAMLIAFIAVIAMADTLFKMFGEIIGFASWGQTLVPELLQKSGEPATLSFSLVFGWFFAPLAWLMGIPSQDCLVAGVLLGQKVVLNEFIAYLNMAQIMTQLNERTVVILSYALCGFANFSSIGIQIGGIGNMAPNRKTDLARLGIRSVIGGSIAAFMTAAVAGMLL